MSRNTIKIVADPATDELSFFYMNEAGDWASVSPDSELSRAMLRQAPDSDSVRRILLEIDDTYNQNNRGVDIRLKTTVEIFSLFSQVKREEIPDRDIFLSLVGKQVIFVAGKRGTGKSVLIEELAKANGIEYTTSQTEGHVLYSGKDNSTDFYEIKGLDYKVNALEKIEEFIQAAPSRDMTTFLYCLSGYRLEDVEETLIKHVATSNSSARITVIYTKSTDATASEFAEELSVHLGGVKVIPVLARDYTMSMGTISAFGVDELSNFIFGGR